MPGPILAAVALTILPQLQTVTVDPTQIQAAHAPAPGGVVAAPTVSASGDVNADPYLTARGGPYDGVVGLLIQRPTGLFLCSGALISDIHVLTAAHCIANGSGVRDALHVDVVGFPGPSGNATTFVNRSFNMSIAPGYTGATFDSRDLAVLQLSAVAPVGMTRYSILGTPIQADNVFDFVGFGVRGSNGLGTTEPSGVRRVGFNRWDALVNFGLGGMLTADFDSVLDTDGDNVTEANTGALANDAMCFLIATGCLVNPADQQLGIDKEAMTGPGDSGGPAFINGQIAGVASWIATFGPPVDTDAALNSSFGELAGWTNVQAHRAFINAATTVPEPGTVALVATGLLALGAAARRRRG